MMSTGGSQATPTIVNNNIYSNAIYGVEVADYELTDDINAQFNWWGDLTGPSHSSNEDGIGDRVTDKVDYSNWLLSEY